MRPLAVDDEQVAFWRRNTWFGVGLSAVLPLVATLHTLASPSRPHGRAVLVLAAVVLVASPAILLMGVLVLVVATGTSAFTSQNHVRSYRQVTAYAQQVATSGHAAGDVVLLAAADRAVYRAKRAGRDRVVISGPTDR